MSAKGEGVRAVERALSLLDLFREDRMALSINELVKYSELPKTTVVRLVATLQGAGLVWVRPDGSVVVGPGLLRWSHLADVVWRIPARPVLSRLANELGETVHLQIRQEDVRMLASQVEGTHQLRYVGTVGECYPLWKGAASLVLLGDANPDFINALADRMGVDGNGLLREVEDTRTAGHAITHEAREAGVSGIAVPVLDSTGTVGAALVVVGPTVRFDHKLQQKALAVLPNGAADLSEALVRIGLIG